MPKLAGVPPPLRGNARYSKIDSDDDDDDGHDDDDDDELSLIHI